jgi:hypothetical protein
MTASIYQGWAADASGNIIPNATITVRDQDSNSIVTLWSNRATTSTKTNPFDADANGYFFFYRTAGRYKIEISDGTNTVTLNNVQLGTASERDTGTSTGQIPLADDLAAVAFTGNYAQIADTPALGTMAARDTGTGDQEHRTNVQNNTHFLRVAQNLNDLESATSARANLGLGSAALVEANQNLRTTDNVQFALTTVANATADTHAVNRTTGDERYTRIAGIDWEIRTSAADNQWFSVTYGNGLFVAVAITGSGNRVMTSPDGINWTARTSAANNQWAGVTYGNGLFVAVAVTGTGNRVMTSPDGINWTARTTPVDNEWRSVTYGNGLFVAVAISGTGNRVMTSPDGINWTARTTPADNQWFSVTYGNGLFVAVAVTGTGNRVMTSSDGITWDIRTSAANNQWFGVAYGNGLFVAVADSGAGDRVMTSLDGITWDIRTTPDNVQWRSVAYGNGLFVAVAASGTGNRVMTSSDGITWDIRTSAADNEWRSVTYGNGLFVAVGITGTDDRVMTSGVAKINTVPENNIYHGDTTFTGTVSCADATDDAHALNRGVGNELYVRLTTNQTIAGDKTFTGLTRIDRSAATMLIFKRNNNDNNAVIEARNQLNEGVFFGFARKDIFSVGPGLNLNGDGVFDVNVATGAVDVTGAMSATTGITPATAVTVAGLPSAAASTGLIHRVTNEATYGNTLVTSDGTNWLNVLDGTTTTAA